MIGGEGGQINTVVLTETITYMHKGLKAMGSEGGSLWSSQQLESSFVTTSVAKRLIGMGVCPFCVPYDGCGRAVHSPPIPSFALSIERFISCSSHLICPRRLRD